MVVVVELTVVVVVDVELVAVAGVYIKFEMICPPPFLIYIFPK